MVSRFVRSVLPPMPPRRDLRVVCKCGHECLEFDFRKHVISGQHEKEFFEQLNNSEALGAQAAVLRVAEMLSDLGQRATRELMAAAATSTAAVAASTIAATSLAAATSTATSLAAATSTAAN